MENHAVEPQTIVYRPDVDGLRAVAVLVVLLFHARLGVQGGFVGVDVFFVLSGFLITSIILKDAASAGGFNIYKFWERRIRRIVPALLVVIASTVIIAWFVFLPSDFKDLGKSVLAQAVFSGNFYFWLSGGYFAQPALLKPLLHTWSLAVEEQYYLFFPILFLIGKKRTIATQPWLMALMAVVSLAISVVLTKSAPGAAFYLLPSRAWELLGGALLAMMPGKTKVPRWLGEMIGWSGFCAIVTACCFYNQTTPFPGLAAVLPCAGTLAVIWANDPARQSSASPSLARLLSIRPIVFLGKISYSLYLWHWPMLVYALYWQDNNTVRWPIRAGLLGFCVLLAAATWKFVETPFRTRRVLPSRRAIFALGVISPVACAVLGAALILGGGMPSRFSEAVLKCDAARVHHSDPPSRASFLQDALQGNFQKAGRPGAPVQCLVWGDSHAMAVSPAISALAAEFSSRVEFAMYPATPPIVAYESRRSESLGSDSKLWCKTVVEHVRREHIKNVLLVANWLWYFESPTSPAGKEAVDKLLATVTDLREAGATVWIMKTVPAQPVWVPIGLAKALIHGHSTDIGVTKPNDLRSSRLEDQLFAPALAKGAVILDPSPYFFQNRERCLVESSGYPLYGDDNHINSRGAMMLLDLFRPIWTRNSTPAANLPASHPKSG